MTTLLHADGATRLILGDRTFRPTTLRLVDILSGALRSVDILIMAFRPHKFEGKLLVVI